MPNNIDERIVEMTIDNRQFVKGANKTITVLDKLKSSLNFKDQMNGLDKFEQSIKQIDFSVLINAIEKISDSFSSLGIIGKRVLENLADSIYSFTARSVKSLSVDQIMSGYSKYEQKMKSVQTMMAATATKIGDVYTDQEDQLESINEQMDRLVFFTDETSYSFEGMARNMASFISAGISIESARIDMQGIAAAAGLAGASVEQATRVMNNLSQAIAMGSLKLQDWTSLEANGFVTDELKKVIVETAVECGKLTKTADGMYKTIATGSQKAMTFTAEGLRGALSTGFVDKEVIEKVLHKYGEFSDVLNTVSDDTGATATDLLAALELYEKGELDFAEFQADIADYAEEVPSIYALQTAMETLSDEQLDLGKRAFRASQEYNSFADAINATKDAVSTGWMTTFEYIFGDYLEAKKVWTEIGGELYDIFAAGAERRNNIMSIWQEDGGRLALLETFRNLFDALMSIFGPIKEAFQNIFRLGKYPKDAAEKLIEITEKVRDFSESLILGEGTIEKIQKVFETFFGVLSNLGSHAFNGIVTAIKEFKRILEPIKNAVYSIFNIDDIQTFADKIESIVTKFGEFVSKLQLSDESLEGLEYILSKILGLVDQTLDDLDDSFFNKIITFIEDTIMSIHDLIEQVLESKDTLDQIYAVFEAIFNFVYKIVTILGSLIKSVGEELKRLFAPIKNAFNTIFTSDQLVGFIDIFSLLVDRFVSFVSKLKLSDKALEGFEYILTNIFGAIRDGINGIANSDSLFSKLFSFIGKLIMFFRNLANAILEAFAGGFNGETLWSGLSNAFHGLGDIVGSIWDFVASIFQGIISFIDKIKSGIDSLGGIIGIITKVFEWLSNLIKAIKENLKDAFSENGLGGDIIKIAAGIALIITAILKGEDIKWPIKNFIKPIKDLLESISGAFDALGEYFESKKWQTYGEAFKRFGLALLFFAAALWILSSIDVDKLGTSLLVLVGVVGGLMEVMWVFDNNFDGKKSAAKIAIMAFAMIELAAAILIISIAIALLSFANPDKVAISVLALAAMLAVIIGLINSVDRDGMGKLALLGFAMIEIAAAIAILAIALALLSLANIEKVWSSVGALVVLFTLMLVFTDQIEKKGMGQFALLGFALIEIAAAIAILAIALALLSLADYGKVWSSVGALVILLALILVFTEQIPEPEKIILLGVALVAIAAAMAILAVAIVLLSFVDYGKMFAAVGAIVLLLAAIVVIAMIAQEFIVGAAAILLIGVAIVLLAAAFLVIAISLRLLEGVDLLTIAGGLAVVGAALLALSVGLIAMGLGLVGAIALAIAAAGLLLLGFACKMIGTLDLVSIAVGLWALAPALIALGAVGVPLLAGAAGLLLGAFGIAAIGLALIPLSMGLQSMENANWDQILKAIAILGGLAAVGILLTVSAPGLILGAAGFALIGLSMGPFAKGIHELDDIDWESIVKYLVLLGGSGVILAALTPVLVPLGAALTLFGIAAAAAGEGIYLAGVGMEKITESLKSIPEISKSALLDIVTAMKTAVSDIKPIGEEAVNEVVAVSEELIKSIRYHGLALVGAYDQIINNCITLLNNVAETFKTLGGNLDAGLANGIYERANDPVKAIHDVAAAMVNQFATDFDINSPSKIMEAMAAYIPIGAAKGLEENSNVVDSAMATLGSDMLAAIYPSLQALQLLLNEEYNFSPTITPIVDMTNVDSSAAAMRNMLASADMSASINARNLDAMISNAGRITEEMNAMGAGQVSNGDSFVINVYSQPGMDENELANAVMYKIQNGIIRKGAALG